MEDQDRKEKQLEQEMQIFRHKGKPHYSYKGHFISCEKYAFYRSLNKSRDEIMFEHAVPYWKLFEEQDREYARKHPPVHIHTVTELMKYITDKLLASEQREKMKKQLKPEMTIEQKIDLFPEVYKKMLKMFIAHQEKNQREVQANIKSLEKTLESSLSGMPEKIYTPDAFIEVGSSEEDPQW